MSVNIKKFEIDNNTKANYLIIGKFFYTIPILKDIIRDNSSIIITYKERQKEYNPETCTFYDKYDEFDIKMSLPLNEVVWTVLQGKVLMIEDITN
jgi:hypothetical protein